MSAVLERFERPIEGQLGLELDPEEQRRQREATIQEAFERFDRENPHVYTELVMLARRYKRRGNRKCGIGMLFEVLRWRSGMRTGGDDFKLNNNYRSRYVRKMMREYPEFDGWFEIRELQSA